MSVQKHVQGQLKFKEGERDCFLTRIAGFGGIELVLLGILLIIELPSIIKDYANCTKVISALTLLLSLRGASMTNKIAILVVTRAV